MIIINLVKFMNKLSYNVIANKSNIQFTRIFHIYRNGKNCKSKISFYLKGSVKKIKKNKKINFRKKKKNIFSSS